MFHRSPNATSVLLVRLVEGLRQGGFQLFDVQLSNPHLERFGCYTVSDGAYGALLEQARRQPANLRLGQDAIASEAWMRE
jgi:leucyl/phenylalanyl-tRNA--protein transferase